MVEFIKNSSIKTIGIWLSVIRLMIPIAISVKILEEFGAIEFLGSLLEPLMISIGLPGVLGLVWAVALITNLWTAALVFVTISSGMEITSAEVTILGIMMLFAHGLPLEIRMAQKCGVGAVFSIILRVGSAIITAYLFNWIFTSNSILQDQATIYISTNNLIESTYFDWVINQLQSYIIVFIMLFVLTIVLDLLKHFGLVHKLGEILSPYFKLMGLSKSVHPLLL
ncbi:putative membrane protein [Vibrio ishigakensis]|uniref:Putative membrane protein n=1 Tax=Vibrio ishigakensis TaxID=1481914 RepID=A0A0B8PE11_9VIBR|nr:putative membrane protein [Vibrio ishigakensis]